MNSISRLIELKKKTSLWGWFAGALMVAATGVSQAADVYVIHGIDGQDLGQSQALTVDIKVTGADVNECIPSVEFKGVLGPVELPTGQYNVVVSLSDGSCGGAVAIDSDVELQLTDNVTLIAHLNEAGSPTLSQFANDIRPTPDHQGRFAIRHTAAVNEVTAVLAKRRRTKAFFDLVNGESKTAEIANSDYDLYVVDRQKGFWSGVVAGPVPVTIETGVATYFHAVGSLKNGTFTVIPLEFDLN